MKKTVIAIIYHEGKTRGVRLRKDGSSYQLLACRPDDASELIASIKAMESIEAPPEIVIGGYEASGVAFYPLQLPRVESDQVENLVQLQAEAILPLPADQMEWAWQVADTLDHQLMITIAAARTDQLLQCYQKLQAYHPCRILLQEEAIAFAAGRLFDVGKNDAVLVYPGRNHTCILQMHSGRLIRSARVDLGRDQLADADQLDAQAAEQLAHDLRAATEYLGCTGHNAVPLMMLSDRSSAIEQITDYLNQTGVNITTVELKQKTIVPADSIDPNSIYDCLGETGLALMELEEEPSRFNLFDRFYQSDIKPVVSSRLPSWPVALAAVVILLITLLLVMYHTDTVRLEELQNTIQAGDSAIQLDQLTEQKNIRQTIAAMRPNLLEMISELDQAKTDDLLLDSLAFKRGKRVSITGHCKKEKDLFKFQQTLQNNKHFKTVRAENVITDKEGKKIDFTITFDYRNITK